MRKSLFENMRFPEGFWYEDMITRLVMMRLAKKISLCSKVVYHKCEHLTNASNTLWKTSNIKAADQYWLSYNLIKYSTKVLKTPLSYILYAQLLREYSSLLYYRTENLPNNVRKAIFILASSFLSCLNSPDYHFSGLQKQYNEALLNKKFYEWEAIALKSWLKSKFIR